jgi:flagellar biosynthesis protein FlhB
MADDKSEQPTPKRLQDARKKGQVSKSNDLTQAFLFLTIAGVLTLAGKHYVDSFKFSLIQFFDPAVLGGKLTENAILGRFGNAFANFLLLSAPLLGATFIASVALNFLQLGGLIFTFETLSPKFTKLNPVQGFQGIFFKGRTYFELAKNLVKFAVILWLAYSTFRANVRDVILAARIGLRETAALASMLIFQLLFKVGGVFLVIGAADFMIQKKMYMKSLMMSKEEVKREYKEDEGDPNIKHQRQHLHQQLLSENMVRNVPKADAVVVNPTHLAVALKYEQSQMTAPLVTAKGQMLMAQKIIEVAKRHRVPVVRNVPLAHKLFAVEVGLEIPEDLYAAVAEILNWVYELAQMEQS